MICYGCLEDKKLKNNYCPKCLKSLFGGVSPKPLDFDKAQFYQTREELAEKMSISGVQDKISLALDNDSLKPVAVNGKYILKPVPKNGRGMDGIDDIAANEHLSMIISKEVFKIKTADCALIKFSDGELAYITKRFDYTSNGKKYDQEDFASVLGVTPAKDGANYKYDSKSYVDCANAIKRYVPASIPAIEDFFKRILLNYLICNGDAHLKNFSLYSIPDKSDFMLTPNYDILNTRYHIKNESSDVAMELFDKTTPEFNAIGFYSQADFIELLKQMGIHENRYKIILTLAAHLDKIEKYVENSFMSPKGKEYYFNSYKERLQKRVLYAPKV